MSKIAVAVMNIKGGVGKTTIALILSEIALVRQQKVLAIDLDAQRNFTDGLSFIGSSFKNSLRVKDDLSEDDANAPEEWIVIDCPPEMSKKSVLAIDFADIILVPVKPDLFSLSNLNVLYGLAEKHGKNFQQFPIIKVGYDKSKIANLLEGIFNSKNYPVVSALPLHKSIPYNIATGRIWSTGLTARARKPYVDMYEKIERAFEKMSVGEFEDVWEDLPEPEELEVVEENLSIVEEPKEPENAEAPVELEEVAEIEESKEQGGFDGSEEQEEQEEQQESEENLDNVAEVESIEKNLSVVEETVSENLDTINEEIESASETISEPESVNEIETPADSEQVEEISEHATSL